MTDTTPASDPVDREQGEWQFRLPGVLAVLAVFTVISLVLFFFYSRDARQVTAVVTARSAVLSYQLPTNRPIRFQLPAGRYTWTSASLDFEDEAEYDAAGDHMVSMTVPRKCDDCAAQHIQVKQVMLSSGHLRLVWNVAQDATTPPDFVIAGAQQRPIAAPIQVGYESAQPVNSFRSTHFGSDLRIGELVGARTIDMATSGDVPTLQRGSVRFYGRALLDETRFAIKEQPLREGDTVELNRGYEDDPPEIWLQVNYTSQAEGLPVFDIIARMATDRVHIAQNQAAPGFDVGVSWPDQVAKEPAMLMVYGFAALVAVVLSWIPNWAWQYVAIRRKQRGSGND